MLKPANVRSVGSISGKQAETCGGESLKFSRMHPQTPLPSCENKKSTNLRQPPACHIRCSSPRRSVRRLWNTHLQNSSRTPSRQNTRSQKSCIFCPIVLYHQRDTHVGTFLARLSEVSYTCLRVAFWSTCVGQPLGERRKRHSSRSSGVGGTEQSRLNATIVSGRLRGNRQDHACLHGDLCDAGGV